MYESKSSKFLQFLHNLSGKQFSNIGKNNPFYKMVFMGYVSNQCRKVNTWIH